jgi:two-component system, NarL family, response regulator NreC
LVPGSLLHKRVLLADDHAIVRRGVRTILEATGEYEVCGEAGDGNTTLELALRLRPDIVITDISMVPTNGLEVTRRLHRVLPDARVLILTMHDSAEMLRAAASAGASGYVLKSDAEELLVLALQTLNAGRRFVSPSFAPALVAQVFTDASGFMG